MCFGLEWFEQVLIWLVVVCAIIALLRLVVGFVLPRLGLAGEVANVVVKAVWIVIWAIICIAIIIFVFDLIFCLSGHLSLPRMR